MAKNGPTSSDVARSSSIFLFLFFFPGGYPRTAGTSEAQVWKQTQWVGSPFLRLFVFFGVTARSLSYNRLQKNNRNATLILTSLLEDLV